MNHIRLMMSLTNLGLTPDPLVHTILTIFLCIFMSPLLVLVFWGMNCLHQQESSPKVVNSLHSFGAQITDFPSNFQNQFYSIVWLCAHSVSNRCSFLINMIRRAPMGDIHRPSDYCSRYPDSGSFIQFVYGIYPQTHELWCWDIDKICHKVHLTARGDISAGTFGYFVTEYLGENGRRNQIIGELLINGSFQFSGLSLI